jgi:uncharacterized protein (DUF1778 family)
MSDKKIKLAFEVPAETKRAVERVAAAQGLSVSEFMEKAVQRMLVEAGYGVRKPGTRGEV